MRRDGQSFNEATAISCGDHEVELLRERTLLSFNEATAISCGDPDTYNGGCCAQDASTRPQRLAVEIPASKYADAVAALLQRGHSD